MNRNELALIKQAIINEIEGYEFYQLAAQQAQTKEAKDAFEQLAEEEVLHINWLKKVYGNLQQNKEDDLHFAFELEVQTPKLFGWGKVDRNNASLAVSVFGVAIQMERAAIEFYRNAAQNTENEALKKLYNVLAIWEQTHLEQFAAEYETLKEAWWDMQDFEPM